MRQNDHPSAEAQAGALKQPLACKHSAFLTALTCRAPRTRRSALWQGKSLRADNQHDEQRQGRTGSTEEKGQGAVGS